jgi:hypothetical protein
MVTEHDYHSRGVIAIKVCEDPWFHVSRDEVYEAMGAWLGVPCHDIDVEFFPTKGFLVLLPTSAPCDKALSSNTGLTIRQAKLQLLSWTRMAGAEPVKLPFKVHLCIEGVPNNARQASVIRKLLPNDSLFECIDYGYRSDNEANCCCVFVWSRNPDTIPKEAALCLEELHGRTPASCHFAEPEAGDLARPHACPVQTFSYEAIIHIDQIVDYRPPATTSVDWPERHCFKWWLGFCDGWLQPPPCRSVQQRLGPHKRDRSPPGDGGAGGRGEHAGGSGGYAGHDRFPRRDIHPTTGPRHHRVYGPSQVWVRKAKLHR